MNYAQTFEEFSKSVSTTDLALYAGAGLILFILFKDKLSPVQNLINDLVNKVKNKTSITKSSVIISPQQKTEDVFFELVASWKQTRDLAVKSGCSEAIKVADQMFPYLSPSVCKKEISQ